MEYKEIIKVFTDGSKTPNRCGYGIHFIDLNIDDISKKFKKYPLTNQRAELYAIYKALKIITKKYNFKQIEIYTDSEYSIKSLTIWIKKWEKNDWKTAQNKPVLNVDIIKKINNIMSNNIGKIKFIHVKAHTNKDDYNSIHNAIADRLACGYSIT